jgi:hypothetical protein
MPYVIKTSYIKIILVFHLVIFYKTIINRFHDLTSLFNLCGAIHNTHIPFTSFSNKSVTLVTSDCFIALWCKQFVMQTKKNWNVYVGQLSEVHDARQLKMFNVYTQFKNHEILQELVVIVKGVKCTLHHWWCNVPNLTILKQKLEDL